MSVVSISQDDILQIANSFPATQQILAQLGLLLRDPGVELEDVTVLLKRDVALAARLIRIANSAAMAQNGEVASVEDAVSIIGFQEVYRLVGFAVLAQVSDGGLPSYDIPGKRFHGNALFTALLMEELARGASEDPRYCYTVGLLRSIGKVALDRLAREAAPGEFLKLAEGERLGEWERSVFGMTNPEASSIILKSWKFPHEIVSAIEGHYTPEGRHMPLTHLLNLAAGMADVLGHGLEGETSYWLDTEEVFRKAGLEPKSANRIIDKALDSFDRLMRTAY